VQLIRVNKFVFLKGKFDFDFEYKDAFIDQQEWRLHEHVETSTKLLSSPFSSSRNQHPAFSATCNFDRTKSFISKKKLNL